MKKQLARLLLAFFMAIGSFLSLNVEAQTCKVTDFLYLNDPQDYQTQGFVHKLKIGTGGTLTEVSNGLGNIPWFPQGGGLGSPHGLGQDLNGNLYIGANSDTGPIAKITCDGTLVNLNFINDAGYNIVSKDGYLFVNSSSNNRISRYALCDGSAQGYVTLNGSTQLDWGLFVSPNGTFYATTGLDPAFASAIGKKAIYRFTPTDADFTNHTDYQPLVSSNDLPPGAAANNLPIPAGGAWLWGITADNAGNMYVVAEDPWFNHQGTTWTGFTWILKYDPNGNLVAWTKDEQTTTPKVGFKGARGILYYPAADVLYLAAGPNGDCVSMVKPSDLSYMGAAAGNVPNQNPKTLRIASEACPVNVSTQIDTTLCNVKIGDKIFLSQIVGACSAPICGGTWTSAATNVGMSFNQCDLSFNVTGLNGCGKFTLTNVGGSCGDFTIEVNVDFANVTAPVIAGSQTVCAGEDPVAFSVSTPASGSGTVTYQWQKSTISCTTGFSDISGATNSTYDPPVSSQTTYYRVVASVSGGCNFPLKKCSDTSNCVTVTITPRPTIADGSATICPGESVDLRTKITNYNTYLSPVWTVGTAGGTAVATPTSVKPTATTTYVLVAQNAAGCKDTANVVVTVNPKPSAGTDQTLACANAATNTLTTSTTLVPSPAGGTWAQLGTTPATATIAGNNVTGMSVAGTYQFIYTTAAGCKDTVSVTVSPCAVCTKPNAGADAASVCQPTATAKLTAVTVGGTWAPIGSPANPSAATIDANGNISGLNTIGTYKFVYSVTGGGQTCTDTAQVIVLAKPAIADGSATICAGESVDLTTKITNYNTYLSPVWTVGTAGGTAVTTPSSVKPTSTTTYVLVAQNAAGCKDTANVVVTVNSKPSAGRDTTLACVNAATNTLATSYTLVPSPAGGTWAQLGTTPATATISGNNVTGMTVSGTYQFIYTTTAGCKDTVAVTVAPCAACTKPDAGADAVSVCQPTKTAKLTAVTVGGTWAPIGSPANPSAATIDGSGNISGLNAAGTYKFVYSVTGGGQTCTDTAQVVVLAKPAIADGSATICAGESVDLTTKITNYDTYLSPVWTVGTAGGTAVTTPSSVKPTSTTTYVLVAQNAAGCKDTANVVVTVNPKPSAGRDTTLVCSNGSVPASVQLSASPAGGTWTALSGNPTGVTVNGSGLLSITNATAQGKSFDFVYSLNGCQDTVKVIIPTCIQPKGSIGDYVWKDQNNNGIQDSGEPAVAGVIVQLLNSTTSAVLATDTTDASGLYLFPNLSSGSYQVKIVVTSLPAGCVLSSQQNQGTDDTKDSDFNPTTGLSQVVTIDALGTGTAKDNPTVDAALYSPKGSIGDYVWKDQNNNGIQDSGEPAVAGVIVQLLNSTTSAVLATDTTNASGLYLFPNLSSGSYQVKIVVTSLPAGCVLSSQQNQGTDDTKDSDFNSTTGLSQVVTIDALGTGTAKDNPTVDAALVVPCVKSSVTLTGSPVCSADVQTYSISFSVTNKLGTVKVNKGVLSGTNPYTVTGIPSGSSVIITDSLSALCKSDTTIVGPNCNCNPPVPVLLAPSMTACMGDTFPTLKATVVGLATVEWFSQPTGGTVLSTGPNYKPSGTVTGSTVFYAQARSTDPTCPTAISTSRVAANINAQTCIDTVDLALKKSINTKIAQVGDVLTYTVKVWNESNKNATGVEVVDSIATTVQFVSGSFVASRGSATISGNVIKWTIGNISANGDTVTLRYQVRATQEGLHFNTAEISKVDQKDKDSTPGNGTETEDDIDRQCFSVPFKLCPANQVEASVPAGYTNVQWFKNGGTTPVATGNVVLLSEVGTYTFTATNQTCPTGGCCPIIIEPGVNCCPEDLCVPFTIQKKKKR